MAGLLTAALMVFSLPALAQSVPGRPVQTGTWQYRVRMEVGGRTIASMTKTLEIRDDRGLLIVTETTRMPAGDTVDEVELTRDGLMTRKRSVTQGPMRMMAVFDGGRAKGSVTVGTTVKPFDVEAGDIFGDGPAAYVVFTALPLAVGHSVALRGFDMFDVTSRVKQAMVTGIEEVSVPAGNFKAFRLRIEPERGVDQEGVWIDVDTRRVVRMTATIADAGAILISELER